MATPTADQAIVDKITALMTATKEDGTFEHSKEDCRAILVACMIDYELKLGPELEGVFQRFLEQIGVASDASPDECTTAVLQWFDRNPLKPELLAAIRAIAYAGGLTLRDDFDRSAAVRTHVGRLTGAATTDAPRAPELKVQPVLAPKPRRGLR